MRYGDLTEEEALKTITWNAAWQLGVEDRVGSIEVGKDADLAIWNGHPFSVFSNVEATLIDGEVFFDKQRDLAMRQAKERERAELERATANQPARERERQRPTEPVVPEGGDRR
jgi:adenine deaminase